MQNHIKLGEFPAVDLHLMKAACTKFVTDEKFSSKRRDYLEKYSEQREKCHEAMLKLAGVGEDWQQKLTKVVEDARTADAKDASAQAAIEAELKELREQSGSASWKEEDKAKIRNLIEVEQEKLEKLEVAHRQHELGEKLEDDVHCFPTKAKVQHLAHSGTVTFGHLVRASEENEKDKQGGQWQDCKNDAGGGDGQVRYSKMEMVDVYTNEIVANRSALKGLFFDTGAIDEYYFHYVSDRNIAKYPPLTPLTVDVCFRMVSFATSCW
jgi:hypothetical protein